MASQILSSVVSLGIADLMDGASSYEKRASLISDQKLKGENLHNLAIKGLKLGNKFGVYGSKKLNRFSGYADKISNKYNNFLNSLNTVNDIFHMYI
jgi:hypothetical protein